MLITTLVVSFCKDGGGSVNVKLWFLVVCVRCEVFCRLVLAGNVFLLTLIVVIFIYADLSVLNTPHTQQYTTITTHKGPQLLISTETRYQLQQSDKEFHTEHTTKNHKFILTLTPTSLQNEKNNVVINIIVVSS